MPLKEIPIVQYSYTLPEELIADYPAAQRDHSRLLVKWADGRLTDSFFNKALEYIPAGAAIVFNNSQVIPARLIFSNETGAEIEIFCLKPVVPPSFGESLTSQSPVIWECLVGNLRRFKKPLISLTIESAGGLRLQAEKLEHLHAGICSIRFSWDPEYYNFETVLEMAGTTPLPPYIKRRADSTDAARYQTVYSAIPGSVAAPTAGLHFTDEILNRLKDKMIERHDITLHVGAGTFLPVAHEDAGKHAMHEEVFSATASLIDRLAVADSEIFAVGTTSVRTLESLYWLGIKLTHPEKIGSIPTLHQWEDQVLPQDIPRQEAFSRLSRYLKDRHADSFTGSTKIMITPGYKFRVTDNLFTNFHQPRSTLLLLVAAFAGDAWKEVYTHAMHGKYRFLSYGDATLLLGKTRLNP